MDDEEEEQPSEILKIVDLLISVRSRKIDRLNRAYREAVNIHLQSKRDWEAARDHHSTSQVEGKINKETMQREMMESSTDVRGINTWIRKEKEIDKLVEENRSSMNIAKSNERNMENISNDKKFEYLVAEKKLEKMKLFKREL